MAKRTSAGSVMSPRHGGPADDRRQGAGGAADHDVLGRAALEQQGVDDHVEADREEGQEGRHEVHQQRQLGEGDDPQGEAEDERVLGRDACAGSGRRRVRTMQLVDVAVQVLVDGVGRARGQRAADERSDHQMSAGAAACRARRGSWPARS